MSNSLHPTIAAYIEASNTHNADALIACFTPDAVVTDESKTHRGLEEIRQWAIHTATEYAFTLEVRDIAAQGEEVVVTCQVTGTFPGSPIPLRHFFTLVGNRIAALTIHG
jgi:uncharacterized protein (TIGR02246 family)